MPVVVGNPLADVLILAVVVGLGWSIGAWIWACLLALVRRRG